MTRTTFQRWTIATLGLLAIGMIDIRYGHTVAISTLLALMLLVAFFGGSGRGYGAKGAARDPAQADAQDDAADSDRDSGGEAS